MAKNFKPLLAFLQKLPAIDLPVGHKSIGYGEYDDGLWWVKFSLKLDHELAWRHVQELGYVLNYLSAEERLPTVFMPVSPAPYLNGGVEFLSWIIESTDPEFSPKDCCNWLQARLPNPVDDLSQWGEAGGAEGYEESWEEELSTEDAKKYQPQEADKAEDCEKIGKRHEWYNVDDDHSACYNCGKVVVGRLWNKSK